MRYAFFMAIFILSGCMWKTIEEANSGGLCITQGESENSIAIGIQEGCTNGCTRDMDTECDISLEGNTVTVTSMTTWETCVNCTCEDICIQSAPTPCGEIGPIEAGTYTIVYGLSLIHI